MIGCYCCSCYCYWCYLLTKVMQINGCMSVEWCKNFCYIYKYLSVRWYYTNFCKSRFLLSGGAWRCLCVGSISGVLCDGVAKLLTICLIHNAFRNTISKKCLLSYCDWVRGRWVIVLRDAKCKMSFYVLQNAKRLFYVLLNAKS